MVSNSPKLTGLQTWILGNFQMSNNMQFSVETIHYKQCKDQRAPSLTFSAWGLVRNTFVDFLVKRSKYVKQTSEMRAKIGRYAATTTTAASMKRYQLTYPTFQSKGFINSKRPTERKKKRQTRSDRFEIKETWTTQITAKRYHGQHYPNSQGFMLERCSCKQCCH